MPATPSRIGFITQEWRKVVSGTSSVQTRYGSIARQTDDPVETWFDNTTDAQTVADNRQALLSAERRRFRVTATGVTEVMALGYTTGVPLARYVDTERNANLSAMISEIVIDLGRNNVALTLWG